MIMVKDLKGRGNLRIVHPIALVRVIIKTTGLGGDLWSVARSSVSGVGV